MRIKIKRINSVETEVGVFLTESEIGPLKNSVESQWQKDSSVAGYRKGKAPLNLVLKRYGKEIKRELQDRVVSAFYKKALDESKLSPVSPVVILSVEEDAAGGYKFRIGVEEKPEVKISKYKNLRLEKKSPSVENGEIDRVLENIKQERSVWVETERPSFKKDTVVADYQAVCSGKVLDSKENAHFYLDGNNLTSEILNNLTGLKKGDSKEFEAEIPRDYYDKKITGKRCSFKFTVNSVRELKAPDIDDDFAKSLGKYKTLDEFKEAIREELQNYRNRESDIDLEKKLTDEIIKNSKLDIPKQLLNSQIQKSAEDIALRLLYRGFPKKEIEKQSELILKEAGSEAETSLKLYFILNEIAKKENIVVTEEDLDFQIKTMAQHQKISEAELRKKLEQNNEIDNINAGLLRKKVIEFLKQNADIVEVKNGGG